MQSKFNTNARLLPGSITGKSLYDQFNIMEDFNHQSLFSGVLSSQRQFLVRLFKTGSRMIITTDELPMDNKLKGHLLLLMCENLRDMNILQGRFLILKHSAKPKAYLNINGIVCARCEGTLKV